MPTLVILKPGDEGRKFKLFRPVTTLGADAHNDICIQDAGLEPTHVQLERDGAHYSLVALVRDLTVNNRRVKQKLLEDGDIIRCGGLEARYHTYDLPEVCGVPGAEDELGAYRRLYDFSLQLMENASTDALVGSILASTVELTGADKGFLILLDPDGKPVVAASHNVGPDFGGDEGLSDSIIKSVLNTRQPLVVANALHDTQFSNAASVLNLKLLSVMCCPLMDHEMVAGALYLGNHRVAHVFEKKDLELLTVFSAQASLLLSQSRRVDTLKEEREHLISKIEDMRFGSIIGACDSMKAVFTRVRKVASTDVSVLVTGETGTGKELIAKEIHGASPRASGPFIVINCGAIPENLLESELFGHVKGAFTGAIADRKGKFQAAEGGTLFLDEIGEMPTNLQVKLLRALQERVIVRVGDTQPQPVDIRIVAATNRDLDEEIKQGRFREDLYYRLNVVNIHLPPLRERGDDIETLAKFLLEKAAEHLGSALPSFSAEGLRAIRGYAWPGNVRQLENRLQKAVVLAEGPELTETDLDILPEATQPVMTLAEAKERFQARYIREVLDRNGGNRTQSAKELGVDARTIFRHLKKTRDDEG